MSTTDLATAASGLAAGSSRRGHFVTFEGLDGSGKTTQMRLLAAHLRERGAEVIETVEPGGTAVGEAIRRILLDPAHDRLGSVAEMLLYFAARAQNVDEVLEPALKRGVTVFSDRWTDSTFAYQGYGRQLGEQIVADLDRIACRGREPDLTLWIDVELEASLRRARSRNEQESAEGTRMDEQSRAFYEKVLQGYRVLAEREPRRFVRVDGNGGVEEVAGRVRAAYSLLEDRHV
jgi:dTMP kinase